MNKFFSSLDANNKVYLVVIGLLCLFLSLWLFVWMPLSEYKRGIEKDIKATLNDHEAINSAISKVQAFKAKTNTNNPQSIKLQLAATQSIERFSLLKNNALQSLQEQSDDMVSIVFKSASFNAIMFFLADMEENQQAITSSLVLTATDEEGKVNARITLTK